MNEKTKWIIGLCVAIILLGGGAIAYNILAPKFTPDMLDTNMTIGQLSQPNASKELKKAPDMILYDNQKNKVSLSELNGINVISFWQTTDEASLNALTAMEENWVEYGDIINFMAVQVTNNGVSKEAGEDFIATNGLSLPDYYDTDKSAYNAYGLKTLPATLFVDADGNIFFSETRAMSNREIQEVLFTMMPELANGSDIEPTEPPVIPAPNFNVYDKDGNTFSLSDFKGELVVVNFWASWCPPCKSEMPYFNDLAEEYKDTVRFMMVDLTDGVKETQKDGQKYIDENGFTFDVYFDLDSDAAINYGLSSIPATVVVDREGNVFYGTIGAMPEENIRTIVQDLVSADAEGNVTTEN